ncbi:MAG: toll/interleukin-1 receptor domain-containing protein, partial [Clostridia bacterium]|nr:toll/interleukin-1 receptor domain-containing protein [Clostridia bacterium]
MAEHYDVFISYRRSDGGKLAERIYDYLTEKGLHVFFDREEMVKGQYFDEQIRYHVTHCPNYIFIGTPEAFAFRTDEFDYVAEEIRIALAEHDKSPETHFVLPVMAAGTNFPPETAFPKGTEKLSKCDALFLRGSMPTDNELLEILKAVTTVNKHNLWNAAKHWLENSKKEGARFASLHIERSIMPKAGRKRSARDEHGAALPIRVYRKEQDGEGHSSQTERQPLLEAFGTTEGHLYLIGEGGIGKTTALIRVMNDAYEDDKNGAKQYTPSAQVPIFVELSRVPDTNDAKAALYHNGQSSFIRRAIYQQLRQDRSIKQLSKAGVGELDEAFTISPEAAVLPVNDLLTKKTPAPEYLLLLDGLNETSRAEIESAGGLPVVTMIIGEIQWLMENCRNVRIVLTSRTDDTAINDDRLTRLYLSGLEDDAMRGYLADKKLPAKRIDKAQSQAELWETLRIPLFLTIYATLSGRQEVSSRGEILRVFFSERRENLGVYTAGSRIEEVGKDVEKAASATNAKRIDVKMQNFFLDFLLPEIGWRMERKGAFYFSAENVAAAIEAVLTDEGDTAVCGKYGKALFKKYREGSDAKTHTKSTAKKILKKLGDDIGEVTETVLNCCVLSLGIMQESNGEYGFEHHHFRDYFAAVKNIHSLRLALFASEKKDPDTVEACLTEIKKDVISPEVRRFMGEYLSENKNAPVFENGAWQYNVPTSLEDRNLIKRALDIFRGRFGEEVGYGVYNLIEILKDVRGDLSKENLSRLDLTPVTLNGTDLGKPGILAVLTGAKVGHNNLFPVGHSNAVNSAVYSPDGTRIVTAS